MDADVERLRSLGAQRCHAGESSTHQGTGQPRERAKSEGWTRACRPEGAAALLDQPDAYLAFQQIQPRDGSAPGRAHVVQRLNVP